MLWDYLAHAINQWQGEVSDYGDFNEVRSNQTDSIRSQNDSSSRIGQMINGRSFRILPPLDYLEGFNDFVTSTWNSAFYKVLKEFGFRCKWRNWIQSCLTSSKGSILVNGCPTNEFQFYKGLKQGDPLSPFLFILVMESLHLSFQRIVNAGMFKGIVLVDQSLCLSHIVYADDAIFFGSGDYRQDGFIRCDTGSLTKLWLDHWPTRGIFKAFFKDYTRLNPQRMLLLRSKIATRSLVPALLVRILEGMELELESRVYFRWPLLGRVIDEIWLPILEKKLDGTVVSR
ncbi:RNA-directed DNA polymerase, eukaryota [Tanacetum coccineum]